MKKEDFLTEIICIPKFNCKNYLSTSIPRRMRNTEPSGNK